MCGALYDHCVVYFASYSHMRISITPIATSRYIALFRVRLHRPSSDRRRFRHFFLRYSIATATTVSRPFGWESKSLGTQAVGTERPAPSDRRRDRPTTISILYTTTSIRNTIRH